MRIWRGSEYLPLSHVILKVVRIVGAETFVCFKEGNRKRRKGHSGKAEERFSKTQNKSKHDLAGMYYKKLRNFKMFTKARR